MSDPQQNPYEAPAHSGLPPDAKPPANVLRGMLAGAIGAVAGFAIPLVLALAIEVMWREMSMSLSDVLRQLNHSFEASIACAAVFALAGILNYTPARRLGLVRALMCTACLTLLSALLMIVMVVAFQDRRRFPDGPSFTDPARIRRIAVLLALPTAGSTLLTLRRIRSQRRETAAGP